MKNVTKTVTVNINLTADQWQLYTASMDCEPVAKILNGQFNHLANRHAPRDEFESAMEKLMREYSSYGASDSEPRWMLEDLLNEQFA